MCLGGSTESFSDRGTELLVVVVVVVPREENRWVQETDCGFAVDMIFVVNGPVGNSIQ
jgi:hypothetical protein